jgi:hypothetical protein
VVTPAVASVSLTRSIFLRLLGLVYLAAFVSIACQIDGLVGSRGILPAAKYLRSAHEALGHEAYWRLPTLAWIDCTDTAIHLICANGILLSVALIIGITPQICLALLWVLYLSIMTIGQDFLSFQWDVLLLEAGFLAIFYAPAGLSLSARYTTPPSRISIWLFRWLLFRLMFLSGLVKIASQDPTWANWTAMSFHYETQPLPTWTSWHMYHLPMWVHKGEVAGTFFAELIAPFLYFTPRVPRLVGCVITVLLQMLIAATGNFGFFNLLTIALCVPLLEDAVWPKSMKRHSSAAKPGPRWRELALAPLAVVIVLTSSIQGLQRVGLARNVDPLAQRVVDAVGDLHITHSYGLFAVMTTERPEIILQGSDDGITWKSYAFCWKPDDELDRRPRFCTPHMPRLDWQLWFAAMGDIEQSSWTINLMRRLLEGSPTVLGLLRENPFPHKPPRYVRALRYSYHFTTRVEGAGAGDWWKREPRGLFCPPITLQDLRPL